MKTIKKPQTKSKECNHKWEKMISTRDYGYQITIIYICEKCNKFKEERFMSIELSKDGKEYFD